MDTAQFLMYSGQTSFDDQINSFQFSVERLSLFFWIFWFLSTQKTGLCTWSFPFPVVNSSSNPSRKRQFVQQNLNVFCRSAEGKKNKNGLQQHEEVEQQQQNDDNSKKDSDYNTCVDGKKSNENYSNNLNSYNQTFIQNNLPQLFQETLSYDIWAAYGFQKHF